MTWKWDTKTENTFSVLQKKNAEPLLEAEEPPSIDKIDKNEKKVIKGKGNERIKTQSETKGENEMGPKPRLPKNNSQ